MKNVLIISSSMRKGGNSERLAESFAAGAAEAGNRVELISLSGKSLAFCKGCLACQKTKKCVIKDDANDITDKMCEADVIVFATPIYYYEMSGQLKTMLDRANSLFARDYKFRDVYVLSSAAEDEQNADRRAVSGIEGWIECFDKARLAGTLLAKGVTDIGDIDGNDILKEAYTMGISI